MGANQQRGASSWRRAAAEVDASFLEDGEYAPQPRRGPAASTISPREEADSNQRWTRARLREKLRGPVTMTESLSLGLGGAAFLAYASHGIPRRDGHETVDFAGSTHDGTASAPGDIVAAVEARAAEAQALNGSAAEAADGLGDERRAARGTTVIPTTILRPAGEIDGLAWNQAPAGPAPFVGRGQDMASVGRAGPLFDTGLGMAAIHAVAAPIIADADMAAVFAAPTISLQQAAAEPHQAKAPAPDSPTATAKAPPGPGSDATHAVPRPEPVTAEMKPAEPQLDAAATQAKAVQAPAGPASREVAGAPPPAADHAAVQDAHGGAAGDQGKASGMAAVGATLVMNQGIAVARAAALDAAAPQTKAEPDHTNELAGPPKATEAPIAAAPADHGGNVPATGHTTWSMAANQAATLNDIVLAVKFDMNPPDGAGAKALQDTVESLDSAVPSKAAGADHAVSIPDPITLPEAAAKVSDIVDSAKAEADDTPVGKSAGEATDAATKVLDAVGLPKLDLGHGPTAQAQPGADHSDSAPDPVMSPDAVTKVLDAVGQAKADPGHALLGEAAEAKAGADHPGSSLGAATNVLDAVGQAKADPGHAPVGEAPEAKAGADHPGSVLGAAIKVLDSVGQAKADPGHALLGEAAETKADADHPVSVLGAATKVLDAMGQAQTQAQAIAAADDGHTAVQAGKPEHVTPGLKADGNHPASVADSTEVPVTADPAKTAAEMKVGHTQADKPTTGTQDAAAVAKPQPDQHAIDHGNAPNAAGHSAAAADQGHIASTEAVASKVTPPGVASSEAAATAHLGTEPKSLDHVTAPAAAMGHAGSASGENSAPDLAHVTQALNEATKTDHLGPVVTPDHATDPGALLLHSEGPPLDWPSNLGPSLPVDTTADGLHGAGLHSAVADLSIF